MKLYQDKAWMKKKYLDEQLSRSQIAELAGCGVATVRDWMKRFGIKPRGNVEARWPDREKAPYRDEKWIRQKYEVEHLTLERVANLAGCRIETLCAWMDRFDIDVRRTGLQVFREELYKDREWLYQKYWDEGLTLAQMAELSSCDATLVGVWMAKLNVPRRSCGLATEYTLRGEDPPWYDAEWLQRKYWVEELSAPEIAAEVGTYAGVIQEWMHKLGVPFRDVQERSIGARNPNWRGGSSFEPYPIEFNPPLKRAIRMRDNHACAICRMVEGERVYDVHHIDYDKGHNERSNLITLCVSCHRVTNGNRQYWQQALGKLVRIRCLSS